MGDARRITLRLGEEAQNINLTLVRTRYAVVSGTVLNSLNAPVKASVGLFTIDAAGVGGVAGSTADDGTFRLSLVPPGDYTLRIYGARSFAGAPESVSFPISIGGEDVTGIVLL